MFTLLALPCVPMYGILIKNNSALLGHFLLVCCVCVGLALKNDLKLNLAHEKYELLSCLLSIWMTIYANIELCASNLFKDKLLA